MDTKGYLIGLGVVLLMIAVVWLMTGFIYNSWLFGAKGYDMVPPSCKPECSEDEICEFVGYDRYAGGKGPTLFHALTTDSVCRETMPSYSS